MADATLTQDYLKEFYEYKDGSLFYKKQTSGVPVGKLAGWFDAKINYYRIKIKGKSYLTHRMVYLFHHGNLPQYIDHIDGNCLNNKIENLREATHSQNMCNQKIPKNNKSGIKGVSWKKELNKWVVQLVVNGKKTHFGCYFDINVAKFVADTMRYKYHKEFARTA